MYAYDNYTRVNALVLKDACVNQDPKTFGPRLYLSLVSLQEKKVANFEMLT